jgi:hypothetical protein
MTYQRDNESSEDPHDFVTRMQREHGVTWRHGPGKRTLNRALSLLRKAVPPIARHEITENPPTL